MQVDNQEKPGEHFDKYIETDFVKRNSKPENDDMEIFDKQINEETFPEKTEQDSKKIELISLQVNHFASQHPHEKCLFIFIDDGADILKGLRQHFVSTQTPLPKHLTLNLHQKISSHFLNKLKKDLPPLIAGF